MKLAPAWSKQPVTRRPLRTPAVIGLVLLAGLRLLGFTAQGDPRQRSAYWLSTYGEVPADQPPAQRARSVFEKLNVIAYPRPERPPRLLLIDKSGDPYAIALEDGGLVLTRTGLELCYDGRVDLESGDARLAFLLGHELAHLANQDFWHLSAFMALHGDPSNSASGLNELLAQNGPRDQQIELKADQSGLFYMAMAGYDPWEILGPRRSFFREWADQAWQAAADPSHPDTETRERYLRLELEKIARRLDLFSLGVRFLETRQFGRAIDLLSEFRVTFAGPAVLNNLGLAYYLRGFQELARCDGRLAMRYKLPIQIDPRTLAERARNRGRIELTDCPRIDDFFQAREALKKATEMAPDYRPARLNYLSFLLTTEAYAEAAVLLQSSVGEPETEMLSLLAFYLLGRSSRQYDTSDSAIAKLEALARNHPRSAQIAYNRASVVQDLRGKQTAAPLWKRFLELEPWGEYAAYAREQTGVQPAAGRQPTSRPGPKPPGPLGRLTSEGRRWLSDLDAHPTEIHAGAVRGRIYVGARVLALLLIDPEDAEIALIDEKPLADLKIGQALASFGEPLWRIPRVDGEFLLYQGFGLDLSNGRVTAIVHYR